MVWKRKIIRKFAKKIGDMNMGTLIILAMVGIPCVVFLIFCATSNGKNWLGQNNML